MRFITSFNEDPPLRLLLNVFMKYYLSLDLIAGTFNLAKRSRLNTVFNKAAQLGN